MEDKLPDVERDVERLLSWFSSQLLVPSFNVIVVGKREDVPTEFNLFACLYPDAPHCRAYSAAPLPTVERVAQVRQDIANIRLPADAESRYQHRMQSNAPSLGPAIAWRIAEAVAREQGIPIGCYAVGQTAAGGEPRAMLWTMAFVSPTEFTERLQQAARS